MTKTQEAPVEPEPYMTAAQVAAMADSIVTMVKTAKTELRPLWLKVVWTAVDKVPLAIQLHELKSRKAMLELLEQEHPETLAEVSTVDKARMIINTLPPPPALLVLLHGKMKRSGDVWLKEIKVQLANLKAPADVNKALEAIHNSLSGDRPPTGKRTGEERINAMKSIQTHRARHAVRNKRAAKL